MQFFNHFTIHQKIFKNHCWVKNWLLNFFFDSVTFLFHLITTDAQVEQVARAMLEWNKNKCFNSDA